MDHQNLVAIDIHTHAEVSCWNPFDHYGEEYDRAADKYFRNSRRPTIEETIAYCRALAGARCGIVGVDWNPAGHGAGDLWNVLRGDGSVGILRHPAS